MTAFSIDRTEVTRGDYRRCVAARRCAPPADAASTAADSRLLDNTRRAKAALPPKPIAGGSEPSEGSEVDHLPIVNVTWADAQSYCRYAGGRLPTEAEWEKAARGTDGREYPWGDEVSCERANWGNFDGEGPCAGRNPGHPVAVGQYPDGASPYGVLDLGGNVWEWVADRYDDDAAAIAPEVSSRRDGAARERAGRGNTRPGNAERRVVKGGSCCSFFVGPRAANRNAWSPDHRDADLGFRCVADR